MLEKSQSHLIVVDKRRIAFALSVCVIVLHIFNIPAVWFRSLADPSMLQRAYSLFFGVSNEGKIPTWYSACAILFSSILLYLIATDSRYRNSGLFSYWAGLALIFAYLSMDEAMRIHELANRPMAILLDLPGAFSFGWIIPALVCLSIFFLVYLRFLFRLPERTRWLFMLSGIVYLSGALGMEMVSAFHWDGHGADLGYLVITTFEELLEMFGIVLFIYSLLDHIEKNTALFVRF